MLPSDRFTQLVPTFKFRSEYGDFSAVVTMPLNSPLREEINVRPGFNVALFIRSALFLNKVHENLDI